MDAGDAPVNAALFKLTAERIAAHYRAANPGLLPIGACGWVVGSGERKNILGTSSLPINFLFFNGSFLFFLCTSQRIHAVEGALQAQAAALVGGGSRSG